MKITSNKIKLSVSILLLAIVSTVATVYTRVEVLDKAQLDNLVCGWPMQYLSSGYPESRLDPPYPWTASCMDLISGEWGDPVEVEWPNLILSVLFFYLLLLGLFYVGQMARKAPQKK